MTQALTSLINDAFERRADFSPKNAPADVRSAVDAALDLLDSGSDKFLCVLREGTVIAGGVGGSRFTRGVAAAYPDAEITVVVNTGDDIQLHGLHISPDLDTMMYALGGGIDPVRGWGRTDESWQVLDELKARSSRVSEG